MEWIIGIVIGLLVGGLAAQTATHRETVAGLTSGLDGRGLDGENISHRAGETEEYRLQR